MDIRAVFREHGLRWTLRRERVYAALAASESHPTADALHELVGRQDRGLSLATVYNTLEALVDHGLARRLSVGGGPQRFDADMSEHAHVTTPDGGIADLPPDLSRAILRSIDGAVLAEVERRLGVRVRGVRVEVEAGRGM
ncbi:MAG: transcriptional repressor [Leptolyngbya sp. PLA1]|nr:transcriptional repressor [Leptolyngbya sp. PLA1]